MADFKWDRVDINKALKSFKTIKKVRGELIDQAIGLDFHLDVIICKILFSSYTSKEAVLFRRFVLPYNFTFSSKVCFLEKLVKTNNPTKAQLTKQWLEKLKNINTVRNFLAHGHQSNELPLKNQKSPKVTISLIKKGRHKDFEITKTNIEKIRKDAIYCNKFILDRFAKEGLQPYFG